MKLPIDIDTIKGFMPPTEGEALFRHALLSTRHGPALEIGSYCGKSAVYIGTACQENASLLFTIDHHRGSEETQPGWEHHDPETWDASVGAMDTLPFLRRTLFEANLEGVVLPIVGPSAEVARFWQTPLAFLFIDGGHGLEPALQDYRRWSAHVQHGGILAIHDVFPDPEDGGRPPYEIYLRAQNSDLFEDVETVGSLRVLKRL